MLYCALPAMNDSLSCVESAISSASTRSKDSLTTDIGTYLIIVEGREEGKRRKGRGEGAKRREGRGERGGREVERDFGGREERGEWEERGEEGSE